MIPFASIACMISLRGGEQLECSLRAISAIGFTLRLPACWAHTMPVNVEQITMVFHAFKQDERCILNPKDWYIDLEHDEDGHLIWHVETMNSAFRALARCFMQCYEQYTALKADVDDAVLSQTLTGYPAAQENCFAQDWASQRADMLRDVKPDARWQEIAGQTPELAVCLGSRQLQQQYMQMSMVDFSAWYWQTMGMAQHPVAERAFNCAYIGSAYCPLLLPDADQLLCMIDKAIAEQTVPVVVLPPVQELYMDRILALLACLDAWCSRSGQLLELVVHDLGLLVLIRQQCPDRFRLTLGTMLQKRRKDARMPYMHGFGGKAAQLAENALNASFYQAFLAQYGVTRYAIEACGYDQIPPAGTACVHLPFYQTNTAGHCTLYAACTQGDRSRQQAVLSCPGYCETAAYLYPVGLGMAARYNSLFGFDRRSLMEGAYLSALTGSGAERLVFDLL